jgi:hypothetical protein
MLPDVLLPYSCYSMPPFSTVNSEAHQTLALESARQSITLLKNEKAIGWKNTIGGKEAIGGKGGGSHSGHIGSATTALSTLPALVLPFSTATIKKLAVIGPNANCTLVGSGKSCNQLGNYATFAPFVITPAQGLAHFTKVVDAPPLHSPLPLPPSTLSSLLASFSPPLLHPLSSHPLLQ